MMLQPQAFIDDSGSEPTSRVFVLAGFIAPAASWAEFVVDWRAVLDLPPKLEYFKMAEASNLSGQFKGWDEAKRDERVNAFIGVILKHAKIRVHVGVRNDLYEKYITSLPVPERKLAIDSPYVLLFMQLVLAVGVFSDRFGIQSACDFFFDEQGEFSKAAEDFWSDLKRLVMTSKRSDLGRFIGSMPTFRDDKDFLPLQAADLYAWHMRQHWSRNRFLIVRPSRTLKQFENMPVVSRVYDEAELQRLRAHLEKGGEIFAANNPTIPFVHAGKTKRERKNVRRQTKGALDRAVWSKMPERERP